MSAPATYPARNRTWKAKLEYYFTRTESAIAVGGLALLLLLSLAEIGARNFFHTAIPGADIVDRNLVLWVSFLGAVIAVRERHIKIDLVSIWMPENWRRRLERPIFFFSAIVCGAMFWSSMRFWVEEWRHASDADKWIAAMSIIIPLCFFLLASHFVMRFLIGPRSVKREP